MKLRAIIPALLTIPAIAVAQSNQGHECTMGDLVRRVVVETEGSAPVPCEVAYYKDTEAPGEREALWNAQNDAGFCSARATEFVSRLEGLGWTCAAAGTETEVSRNEDDPDPDPD